MNSDMVCMRPSRESFRGTRSRTNLPSGTVIELVENFDTDTYRAVYTAKFEEAIYVLHCFQKKSSHGKKTSKQDDDLINQRYKDAKEMHEQWLKEKLKGK